VTDHQSDFVSLDAQNPSSHARRMVRAACRAWPPTQVEDAELMVTELVANALTHGRGDVRVRVAVRDQLLEVAVSDDGPARPVLAARAPLIDDETGRGLHIVDELAHAWGTSAGSRSSGKSVWFSLRRDVG
jgi:anti-sigma regulatory factor (Ser/Thr protein kinase)